MTTSKPILLFDVMDTLVRDPFYEKIPPFFGLTMDELLVQKHPTAWVRFERGELSPQAFYESFFADGRFVRHVELEALFRRSYAWVDGMKALLAELRSKGIEMHALSNYPVWYRMIDEELGLGEYVEWTFVSCKTGRRKPDAAAYLEAARAVGRQPAECLFVDDRQKNCSAAEAVGMPAVRFESARSLHSELRSRGVL